MTQRWFLHFTITTAADDDDEIVRLDKIMRNFFLLITLKYGRVEDTFVRPVFGFIVIYIFFFYNFLRKTSKDQPNGPRKSAVFFFHTDYTDL